MQLKNILILLCAAACVAVLLLPGLGCASIVPPSGGPRDTLPPEIVEVSPPNESLNFKEKEVTIDFNEYIELEDVYKNLIVSPFPKVMPEVTRKFRRVTVKIKDTLQPNTTYVYNFARVIKDLNEGNRGKDLLYVFSTGNYFDSLQLSGSVKMARTGKPDSTLTVILHSNLEDSAIAMERPRYITRVDTTGTFFFRHLAAGTYRLYALKDEGGAYLYNGEQIFAFADSSIVVDTTTPEPIMLWAYEPEKKKEEQSTGPAEIDEKEKRLKFQTNLEGEQQDLLKAFTMTFANPLKVFDTTKISLTIDSAFQPVKGARFRLDSTSRIMTMNVDWQEDTLYNLILEKEFASDSIDRQIFRKDTIQFKTKSREDYGQVKINFLNLDTSINPVLLISQNNTVKDSFPLTSNLFQLQLYNPGEYDMEILHDANKNRRWDPGAFFNEHRQPEMVDQLERKLIVKPNWTTEFEIKLLK